MHNQPFEEDAKTKGDGVPSDLFFYGNVVGFREYGKQEAAKKVSVSVRKAQLVGNTEKQVVFSFEF